MVTVYRGPGWKIAVYGGDHGTPHFHIEAPEYRCSVAIETGDLIVGTAPTAVLRTARAWARGNRDFLIQTWRELNA